MNLGHIIFDVAKLAGGLLLAAQFIKDKTEFDAHVDKATAWLGRFQIIIGGTLLALGILYVFQKDCLIMDIVAALAGLVLLGVSLKSIPAVGEAIFKISNEVSKFAIPIGIIAIISGVLGFVGVCL